MAITSLAQPADRAQRGPTCEVCAALLGLPPANLPPDEAAALKGHLSNPAWRYSELSEALAADQDYPLDLPANSLSRHARGRCAARDKLR